MSLTSRCADAPNRLNHGLRYSVPFFWPLLQSYCSPLLLWLHSRALFVSCNFTRGPPLDCISVLAIKRLLRGKPRLAALYEARRHPDLKTKLFTGCRVIEIHSAGLCVALFPSWRTRRYQWETTGSSTSAAFVVFVDSSFAVQLFVQLAI